VWITERARRAAVIQFRSFKCPYKLHLGCGGVKLEGWINIDRWPRPGVVDVRWDVTKAFPLADASCSFIYHEHLLEHLTVDQGVALLTEGHRLLADGGVMRLAMPCLKDVVDHYRSENWRDQEWLQWPEYRFVQTRAEMINLAFRRWGHQWLYDREELHRRLREAGFTRIVNVGWRESAFVELRNLETRQESKLICDAQKCVTLSASSACVASQ
jgi:predicted SAM-dependent methyltransferase